MEASQFAMWLQGFAELSAEPPTKEQWQSIREHLQTVFVKVTPPLKVELKPAPEPVLDNEALKRWFDKNKQQKPGDYCIPLPHQPYWLTPTGGPVITC